MESDDVLQPPVTWRATLRFLGPGLVIAAAIVGSGELIATTKTGAEAGFRLLWLIVLGCVIKVFVQVEFGRYAIHSGKKTMTALAEVPSPRILGKGNLIVWYWFLMFCGSVGQLGGIVGGVGQALSISVPLTAAGREYNRFADATLKLRALDAVVARRGDAVPPAERERLEAERLRLKRQRRQMGVGPGRSNSPPIPPDDKYWAVIIAVVTSLLLYLGRYRLIQWFATAMVAAFTLVTMANLGLLQLDPLWRITPGEIWEGLRFRIPESRPGVAPMATALATFGIIGVGATELIAYPYWCLERGYGRFVGAFDGTPAWYERARGWLRVMRWDAWCSMVIYTVATVAFYLLGAAVLGRAELDPQKQELIRTLAVMYEPVFGAAAAVLFLFGAFAVLYSTFFVANAGNARMLSDALGVLGFASTEEPAHRRRVRMLSGLFPLLCAAIYVALPQPAFLVLLSGLLQAVMLPLLAIAALYFRFAQTPRPLQPGRLWDLLLVLSAAGMTVVGGWALWAKITGG